ncbi:MAG: hypothetical protein ACERKO_12375, partial [Acetanaerobacterium sp.]
MNRNEDPMRELPLGLGMALMKNTTAMDHFTSMTQQQQQMVIDHTKAISSKREMQQYVRQLAAQPP